MQLRHSEPDRIAQFHSWRTDVERGDDVDNDDDDERSRFAASAASSNGFMRVPTHDPDDVKCSTSSTRMLPIENPIYMGGTTSSTKVAEC